MVLVAYFQVEVAYQDDANQVEEEALVAFQVVLAGEEAVTQVACQPFLVQKNPAELEGHQQTVDEVCRPGKVGSGLQEAARQHFHGVRPLSLF